MIDIFPYAPHHFDWLNIREAGAVRPHPSAQAVSLFVGEEIIAILGGVMILEGVMLVWALVSDKIRKYPVEFHKTVKGLIDYQMDRGVRRMQLTVKSSYEMGARWAEALGFQREGTMRKYHPDGSDSFLYARTA